MQIPRPYISRLSVCLFLISALFIFVAPSEASADKPTAKAARLSGPIDIILPDGRRLPLSRGDLVQPGQTIACGPDSHLVLMVSDGSRFELFENTMIEVNKLLPQEKSRFSLSLFFGRVAAKIKKLKGDGVSTEGTAGGPTVNNRPAKRWVPVFTGTAVVDRYTRKNKQSRLTRAPA